LCGIITVGATAIVVTIGSLKCQIAGFRIFVRFMRHSLVNRYITKQNKPVTQVQDIQKTVGAVMNEMKLRYAAAIFALNPSAVSA